MDGLAEYGSESSDEDVVAEVQTRAPSNAAAAATAATAAPVKRAAETAPTPSSTAVSEILPPPRKKSKKKKSKKDKKKKKRKKKKAILLLQSLPSLLDHPSFSDEDDDGDDDDDTAGTKSQVRGGDDASGGKKSVLDLLPAPSLNSSRGKTGSSLSKQARKSLAAIGISQPDQSGSQQTDEATRKASPKKASPEKEQKSTKRPDLLSSINSAPETAVEAASSSSVTSSTTAPAIHATGIVSTVEPVTSSPASALSAVAKPSMDMYANTEVNAAPLDPLPLNWSSAIDPNSGQEYYYNTITQETRWERPTSAEVTAAPARRVAPAPSQQPYQESAAHAEARLNSGRWQTAVQPKPSTDFDLESFAGGDRSLMRELRGMGGKIRHVNAGAIHQADQWRPDPNAPKAPSKKAMVVPHLVWNSQAGEKQISKSLPNATHKRKHQLSYLAYQAKAQEFELSQAHARGRKTKSQTQAKYGW